ncbi:class I SAM-dependent methyltransferase [Deltaproteobacteria bacterium IMCC39524]|nr:class I SAM-dependent methyltransferase [Deltaproteobacteria bacterium IMCC39524]
MKNTSPQPPVRKPRGSSLTRIVTWSQQLLCEVLEHGDLVVDLTAGTGQDTHVLAEAVGSEGQVVAFDLQSEALEQTTQRLQQHDFIVKSVPDDTEIPRAFGVYLVHACHSSLNKIITHPVKAIIANLGYMPGGDKALVTRSDSTLAALSQSLELLIPGGRLAVTVYPAHPGGEEEGRAVYDFFCSLPRESWLVLSLRAANRSEAPFLLVAERIL